MWVQQHFIPNDGLTIVIIPRFLVLHLIFVFFVCVIINSCFLVSSAFLCLFLKLYVSVLLLILIIITDSSKTTQLQSHSQDRFILFHMLLLHFSPLTVHDCSTCFLQKQDVSQPVLSLGLLCLFR